MKRVLLALLLALVCAGLVTWVARIVREANREELVQLPPFEEPADTAESTYPSLDVALVVRSEVKGQHVIVAAHSRPMTPFMRSSLLSGDDPLRVHLDFTQGPQTIRNEGDVLTWWRTEAAADLMERSHDAGSSVVDGWAAGRVSGRVRAASSDGLYAIQCQRYVARQRPRGGAHALAGSVGLRAGQGFVLSVPDGDVALLAALRAAGEPAPDLHDLGAWRTIFEEAFQQAPADDPREALVALYATLRDANELDDTAAVDPLLELINFEFIFGGPEGRPSLARGHDRLVLEERAARARTVWSDQVTGETGSHDPVAELHAAAIPSFSAAAAR